MRGNFEAFVFFISKKWYFFFLIAFFNLPAYRHHKIDVIYINIFTQLP